MKALHDQGQAKILATLTPAQRNMLANTIGYLALSTKPDRKAAAAKIVAALSASQKTTIVGIAGDYHAKSKALMEAAHAKFLANMPADMRARMQAHQMQPGGPGGAMPRARSGRKHTPDAGRILLAMGSHGMDGLGPMHGMAFRPGMPGEGMRVPGMMPPPGAPGARMRDGGPGRMMPPAPAAPTATPAH